MSTTKFTSTAIRVPIEDTGNHTIVLRQLKETTEIAQRLRGDPLDSFVRVRELLNSGVIRFTNDQVQAPLGGSYVPSTRNIYTADSLAGGGSLGADLSLTLVNDVTSPGNSMLYGTNASGIRGWYAQPSGGGGSSPLTTKGDLYTYDTANQRLPVGADTYVLTADSTQATGLKWAPATGGLSQQQILTLVSLRM